MFEQTRGGSPELSGNILTGETLLTSLSLLENTWLLSVPSDPEIQMPMLSSPWPVYAVNGWSRWFVPLLSLGAELTSDRD